MGKLGFEKQLESLGSIKKLYFSWDKDTSLIYRNVEVIDKKNYNVIFNMEIPVNIEAGTEVYKINIIWEEVGIKKFNELKLFGTYWSSYNKMSYDEVEECLIIESVDSDKLVKVYSPKI